MTGPDVTTRAPNLRESAGKSTGPSMRDAGERAANMSIDIPTSHRHPRLLCWVEFLVDKRVDASRESRVRNHTIC
jgi:hypothetical protein